MDAPNDYYAKMLEAAKAMLAAKEVGNAMLVQIEKTIADSMAQQVVLEGEMNALQAQYEALDNQSTNF